MALNSEMDLNSYVYEFANAIAEHCWSAFKSGVMPHKIHPTKASLNNGWISVDDMLPPLFESVLTLSSKNTYQILALQEHYFFDFARNECVNINYITHWQHLPKPPKE